MNNIFDLALQLVFDLEGGYSDDKYDRGGKTQYGITESEYHDWLDRTGQDIKPIGLITLDEAKSIYYADYWELPKLDQVAKINPKLAIYTFQYGVNCGNKIGVKGLQYAVGANPDGVIGNKTLQAIENVNTQQAIAKLVEHQRARYTQIVNGNPTQKVFIKGWNNRINKSIKFLESV